MPSQEQLVPFFTTLVCHGPGSNLWPPVPRSGHSTELSGLVCKVGQKREIPEKNFLTICKQNLVCVTWPELDSNQQRWDGEPFRVLKISVLNHFTKGAATLSLAFSHYNIRHAKTAVVGGYLGFWYSTFTAPTRAIITSVYDQCFEPLRAPAIISIAHLWLLSCLSWLVSAISLSMWDLKYGSK